MLDKGAISTCIQVHINALNVKCYLYSNILLSLFVFHAQYCPGQDAVFSQPYNTPLYLNPGYAGSTEYARVFMAYRNQWPTLGNAFNTYSVSYDQNVDLLHGGTGITLMNDRQGDGTMNRLEASLIYSYALAVNKELSFNAGFQAGVLHLSFNTSDLVFEDMLRNGSMSTEENINPGSFIVPDFGFGILGAWRDVYFGASVDHLTRPDITFNNNNPNPLYRKYTLHAGSNIELVDPWLSTTNLILSPNILYMHQGSGNLIMYGTYFSREPFYLGAWIRQNLSFHLNHAVLTGGIKFPYFKIGYSYDFSVKSEFFFPNFGAHEVTFQMNFEYKEKRKKIRAIKCPKI